jgi:hypothetical protein
VEDLGFVLLLAVIAGVAAFFWFHRRLRPTGLREWQRQWKRIDRSRRREIARTARRGDAVRDPRDARLAIEFIDQIERQMAALQPRRRAPWIEVALVALELLLVLGALVAAVRAFDLVEVLAVLAPVVFVLALLLMARRTGARRAEKFARARRANEALLTSLGYSSSAQPAREGGLCPSSLTTALGDPDETRKN